MNREILYRGKRVDTEKWIEGFLMHYECMSIPKNDEEHTCTLIAIIPETVGEYTGLTDKSGKKIFEGDIVKYNHIANNEKDVYGVIEYRNTYDQYRSHNPCGFIINWQDTPTGRVLREDLPFWCDSMSNAEVIGNIHDNPELLNK